MQVKGPVIDWSTGRVLHLLEARDVSPIQCWSCIVYVLISSSTICRILQSTTRNKTRDPIVTVILFYHSSPISTGGRSCSLRCLDCFSA